MGEIVVNGEARELDGPAPLLEVLQFLGFPTKWIVVERNGEPVPREALGDTTVGPGDRLEIATPMAGG
ncbi:MAG: sulfur carrier protein ThiS [Candidatus Eisenbacteria bacterium]